MQVVETPKANPESLLAIVQGAYQGKVVIPEFQRSFIWPRDAIEELLVSILQGYFIGTFLILDTQPDKSLFPFRVVEGLEKVNGHARPENHATIRLILDGQQRLTSLFYVLYEPPIPLRFTSYPYRFFFRVDLALDEDPSDAIVSVSRGDRRRLAEVEQLIGQHRAIPFSTLADADRFFEWFYHEQRFLETERDKAIIKAFRERFYQFMVPVVALSPDTGKANIVNIFERINSSGVSLSLFDLAVARLYLKGIKLRHLWDDFRKADKGATQAVQPEAVLKVIALLEGKETKRASLLDILDALDHDRFLGRWNAATRYLSEAYKRATSAPGGYGAVGPDWIPYTTMLVPLAALLHRIDECKGGEDMYRKLDRWYWASVFSQKYDHAVDSGTYADVRDVGGWFEDGDPPAWLASMSPDVIDPDVDERRSAVYKGLMCLVVLKGARDFCTGQAVPLHECEDDHIFPRAKFKRHARVNSILNRTLIYKECNRSKTDKLPSEYLPILEASHGGRRERLQETLSTHFIPDDGLLAMQRDNLDAFLQARRSEFLAEIRRRIGGSG
jgi:hypothetical protein